MAAEALVSYMNELCIDPGTDCSEIAEALWKIAHRSGTILHITPATGSKLRLSEYGRMVDGFIYHDVFTDGEFAYDPRFSLSAVPLEEYLNGIRSLNPGAVVTGR